MHFNKKASLELSIRAIVIIVMAMTILGLGLGFTKNMFKNIGGISSEVTDQVRQQIQNDLVNNDKRVSFSRSEIILDMGDSELLSVGIRNKKDTELKYKMLFTAISGPTDGPTNADAAKWFQYASTNVYELGSTKTDIRNVRLHVDPNTASIKAGSYFFTFQIEDTDLSVSGTPNYYATKDFFVVVR
jgi:hypothetical protein